VSSAQTFKCRTLMASACSPSTHGSGGQDISDGVWKAYGHGDQRVGTAALQALFERKPEAAARIRPKRSRLTQAQRAVLAAALHQRRQACSASNRAAASFLPIIRRAAIPGRCASRGRTLPFSQL
jgi:hypothetical protein